MNNIMKKIFASLIAVAILIAIVFITITTQSYRFWIQDPSSEIDPVLFEIEQGTSFSAAADALEEQGLIASDFWFTVYAKLDGSAGSIRAGVYQLQPKISYANLIDMMTEYTAGADISMTIPEGYSLDQIGEVVMSKFEITQEDWDYWIGVSSPLEQSSDFIRVNKPDSVDLEGYLFPDTYRFYPDATAEDIVTTMADEMVANVVKSYGVEGYHSAEQIYSDVSFDTIHELITLASVIEKEVPTSDDMKIVSGIFQNRLNTGMALQSCATVNYITGNDDPAVSAEDLGIDSPYNTYMYASLPPGPIASPGFAALEAAMHPASTNYYYFLATPDGETIYATTFEEHDANKNRYLY